MPANPKLAVVIPCYNYEAFVERAIRSYLSQPHDDCELVVVDDGSTDNSWEAIKRTGVTAYRIENSGARLACLYGFDKTRAPFVLFLDADDELKPGALRKIVEQLDPGVAKLQFPLTRVDADGNVISSASPALASFRDRGALAREVLKSGVYKSPPTSGNVFRRDLCELLREASYDNFVDGAILFAAPFFGDVVSISEEIGSYRIHGRNDSGLGRLPDAESLERDIARFLARMEHLRVILQRHDPSRKLVDPRQTFYFRERMFCAALAAGRRPPLAALPALLSQLLRQCLPAKGKLAMAAFFIAGSILPIRIGKAFLAYRFKTGDRSARDFAKGLLARQGAP